MTSNEDAVAQARGFQFPHDFDITVMGDADAELARRVARILADAEYRVLREAATKRTSREGNYETVQVRVHCETRARYEQAHALLRADPLVHATL